MAITVEMRTQVSELYVALFGRAPDGEGLGFWVGELDSGKSLTDVANTMYATAPARAYYPAFLTNGEIIESFYQNVLGRAADAEGLAFWTAKLNAAGATPGSVINEMITVVAKSNPADLSAEGVVSQNLFNNKVAVAQWYGEQNGTIAGATAILAGVTDDAATVEAAKAGGVVTSGETFMLTTGVDNITGTSGNDTFIGGNAEIQAADVINGGAGTDTAKLYLDAAANGSLNASGVENFLLQASNAGGATFTATNVVGAEQFVSNGSTTALTVADIQNNVTLGLEKTNANLSASFKAGVITGTDTLTLSTNASGLATAFVTVAVDDGAAASKFTTLDIAATAGKSYITIDTLAAPASSTTDFTTIKTSGAGFVSLTDADTGVIADPFDNVTTVTMAAAGGSVVDLARSANAKNVAVTGAAGDDTIIFAAAQFNTLDTVDLGAGTNVLVLGDANLAQAATVDLTKAINASKGVTTLGTTAVADVAINAARYSAIDSFAVGLGGAVVGGNGAAANNAAGNAGTAAVSVSGVAASGDSLNVQNNLTGGNGSAGNGGNNNGGDGGAGLSLRMALDSGADSFSLSVSENAATLTGGNGGALAGGGAAGAAGIGLDAREIESLSISVSKNLTVVSGTDGAGVAAAADTLVGANATVTITGNGDVNLGNVRANANDTAFQNLTIKAGDLVGALTLTTGAGNDVITVGSKGSTVAAGDGTDTITLGAGVDTVQFLAATNSGNVAGGVITTIDKVIGFQAGLGGDVLDNTLAAASFFNLTSANRDAIKNAGDLKAAADAAANFITTNTTWAAFEYDGKTYAIYETTGANITYDGTGLLVELVGVTATDLVATNLI